MTVYRTRSLGLYLNAERINGRVEGDEAFVFSCLSFAQTWTKVGSQNL